MQGVIPGWTGQVSTWSVSYTHLVSGTVTDFETGEPIAGLWIDVYLNIFHMYSCRTDEFGQYIINVPVGSGYTVEAYAVFDGYANTHFDNVTVTENEPVTRDFRLTELKYATISGKVIDEVTKTEMCIRDRFKFDYICFKCC